MIPVPQAFSTSYARARVKFLEAAAAGGLSIRSHNHPLRGAEGEVLAMDVALDGAPGADRLLIVSSACHGVEGFCGAGVQVHALHDDDWGARAREAGVAVLYLHALNPHGFSHRRRVTHENVDLNRNFLDFSAPLPDNPAYAELHDLLLPATWPPGPQNEAAIEAYIARHGLTRYQAAVSQGQYQFPDGLFFGGQAPTWSHLTLRQVLRDHARGARRVAWIDLHTGLGPNGVGERIYAGRQDPQALARAQAWWGGGGQTAVTSVYDGSSTSAELTGLMWCAMYEDCPDAEYTGIALEFGTLPITEVIEALRADHWLHRHPQAEEALRVRVRQQMMDAFYTDLDAWRGQVVAQARQALFQAVDGLSG
ncbi:MAG TPA: M14 family metallopeptidase [Hydrogenophaga sp.]|uniref:M14 family metallopeptidase n=1 Tax=Hydrogenophaga sp. TaxID=1904254 RepID=UPI002BD3466C|nr:M14 family metallopeptidase [Hydrogenophaga sp.]HMN93404.1 M14 family metallopeptidase [Hydrogenophaga sp.]